MRCFISRTNVFYLSASGWKRRDRSSRRWLVERLEDRRLLAVDALPSLDVETYYQPVDQARVAAALSALTTTGSTAAVYVAGEEIKGLGGDNQGGFELSLINSTVAIRLNQFRAAPQFAGIDGTGFSTVIIDTGIDLNHPHFGPDANADGIADRIVYQQSFVGGATADDGHGHGTHVSGIVGSQDATHRGMAPAASLIGLQTINAAGQGTFGGVEQALQWVVANAQSYNIASVNMSLSDNGNYAEAVSLYGIGDELEALAALDVIVVSAAGNSYGAYNAVGVGYPSADPNSLSISNRATTSLAIVPGTQRHPELTTVFAPGSPIVAARAGGGTRTLSGSSMSSPHVAGVAVLMQQLAVQELGRRLTVDEFDFLVRSSGFDLAAIPSTGAQYQSLDVLALGNAVLAMKNSGVDLMATSLTVSPNLQRGSVGQANFSVANAGSAASGSFNVDLYLSTNGTISETGDIWLGTTTLQVGAAGSINGSIDFALPHPSNTFWGSSTQFTLGLIIDRANVVGESDEGNNLNRGSSLDLAEVTIAVDTTPPSVAGVYARSTNWSSQFVATLGNNFGQLLGSSRTLPWIDVNQVMIQFSEAIDNFASQFVELRNSDGVVATQVAYDPQTFRATLTVAQPLAFGKYRIAASDSLSDASGNVLDGDNAGGAGGLLNIRFDVAIADANGDGRVNANDTTNFGSTFNKSAGEAGFNPYYNWNGDNRVNASDVSILGSNFNRQVATFAEPGAPFSGGGGGSGLGLAYASSERRGSKLIASDEFFSAFGEEAEKRRRLR
jgi:hypothetical protein